MKTNGLSYNSRKALMVHIGESAGTEIASLINQMAAEIEELRRTKVNVTRIVPDGRRQTQAYVDEPVREGIKELPLDAADPSGMSAPNAW